MKNKIKNDILERCRKELDWEIDRIAKLVELVNAVPMGLIVQAFPEAEVVKNSMSIDICLPLSFSLIEEVRRFMEDQFPEIKKTDDTIYTSGKWATHYLHYRIQDKYNFEFHFQISKQGSTCIMNPIGKKFVEQIEYEVVCSKEAAEEFTIEGN